MPVQATLLSYVALMLSVASLACAQSAPSISVTGAVTQPLTLTAAVAQASGGPGRNPGESGLPADQRVVPPPAARAG